MTVRARFRPHPRGFGFLHVVAADTITPAEVTVHDAAGKAVTGDRVFVPPPAAKGYLADDLVDAEVTADDKGLSASSMQLVQRARRMLVGTVQQGPGHLVIDPDPAIATGWIRLEDAVASRVPTAIGRQIVVLAGDAEDGSPVGRALVAGPHVVGSPQAVRAAAVVVALGRAAPTLIPGGPAAAGLDAVEADTTHTRIVGLLAGGGRGGAGGLSVDGPIPGGNAPWVERRHEPCVTIDDADARDLDDAVAAAWDGQDDQAVQVAVHIADVGRAVGVGSPADRYARTMASTAYLAVGDNAPMLDPALAEGALSLLPHEDRWALSARFAVTPDGAVTDVEVECAAIRSRAKLSYASLDAWLAGAPDALQAEAGEHAAEAHQVVTAALEASRRLGVERDARVTFEDLFAEVEVTPAVVDGKLTVVPAEPHRDAYRLIERLMVAANEAVAQWLVARGVPALYRAHTGLDPERHDRLQAAAALVDAKIPALEDPDAEADQVIAQVLAEIDRLGVEGRDGDREVLVAAATAATARATYDPDPAHHRGLASAAYTHFTSPIRRYADLVVHRQIRAALGGEEPLHHVDDLKALAGWLDARAGAINHLQARERADLWSLLLDRGYLDVEEEAVITGVTAAGVKIRLPRLGVSGFVTAERLLGLPPRERGKLDVDGFGLASTNGIWRVGGRLPVRFVGLDDTRRAIWRPGKVGTPA